MNASTINVTLRSDPGAAITFAVQRQGDRLLLDWADGKFRVQPAQLNKLATEQIPLLPGSFLLSVPLSSEFTDDLYVVHFFAAGIPLPVVIGFRTIDGQDADSYVPAAIKALADGLDQAKADLLTEIAKPRAIGIMAAAV